MQLLHPFLELVRDDDLADAIIARGQVGGAEHAELVDEGREAPAIDHHGDRGAGAGLLQHVLIGAELRIGEELDFDSAVGGGGDIVAESL